jgi:hypothetical protein
VDLNGWLINDVTIYRFDEFQASSSTRASESRLLGDCLQPAMQRALALRAKIQMCSCRSYDYDYDQQPTRKHFFNSYNKFGIKFKFDELAYYPITLNINIEVLWSAHK